MVAGLGRQPTQGECEGTGEDGGGRVSGYCPGAGLSETTLGNWVRAYRETHASDEPPLELSERARLRELERKIANWKWKRLPEKRCVTNAESRWLVGLGSGGGAVRMMKGLAPRVLVVTDQQHGPRAHHGLRHEPQADPAKDRRAGFEVTALMHQLRLIRLLEPDLRPWPDGPRWRQILGPTCGLGGTRAPGPRPAGPINATLGVHDAHVLR
jgi:hypothetical protein